MSEKQFKLSKKKAGWARQFKPAGAAQGIALNPPVGIEIKHARGIQRILRAGMRKVHQESRTLSRARAARGPVVAPAPGHVRPASLKAVACQQL